MALLFYEHVAKNGKMVDPYSWRIRLALSHTGIKVKRVPITLAKFREYFIKENLKSLPTVVDNRRIIESSWDVATYLERNFPETSTLFGGEAGTNLAKFIHAWAEKNLLHHLYALIGEDIYEILEESDRPLFDEYLKERFNLQRDLLYFQKDEKIQAFRNALEPFRLTIDDRPFLCGDKPAYADYILYGPIKWAEEIYSDELMESGDIIYSWKLRMDKLFSHLWPDNKDLFI